VVNGKGRELRDDLGVTADRKFCGDPLLQRGEAQLLKPAGLALGERLESEIGQRRPSPERERIAQELRRFGVATSLARCTPLPDEPLETCSVELVGLALDPVAACARDKPRADVAGPEQLTQARDVTLERVRRRRRWLGAPQLVYERIGAHDLASPDQQERKQRALFGRPERPRLAVPKHLERPEDPKLDAHLVPGHANSVSRQRQPRSSVDRQPIVSAADKPPLDRPQRAVSSERKAVKRLTLIISLALALTAAGALAGEAHSASAPKATSAGEANLVPSQVLTFEWLRGQLGWRDANLSRLQRSVFQFAPGRRFALFQPDGYPTVRGTFSISGGTASFSGRYVFSTYPTGYSVTEIQGTLNLQSGRATILLTAAQSLSAYINDTRFGLTNVKMYRSQVRLRVA
jgi:hypothetical protein